MTPNGTYPAAARLWVRFKRRKPLLIASARLVVKSPGDLDKALRELRKACGPAVAGQPLTIQRFGTGSEGEDIEAGFPVWPSSDLGGKCSTRTLEPAEVLAVLHRLTPGQTRTALRLIDNFCDNHGLAPGMTLRRIYLDYEPVGLDGGLVETQAVIHEWPSLLAANVARVLDEGTAREVVRGLRGLRPTSAARDRALWVKAALERLQAFATRDERAEILMGCAHVFPVERINDLRRLFVKTGKVDAVLEAMAGDPASYFSQPARHGDVIVVEKQPSDGRAFNAAETRLERARAFCHCPIVRHNLDLVLPEFCLCGAGWYRQIWEGVLGRPVKVEPQETLASGGGTCKFLIRI